MNQIWITAVAVIAVLTLAVPFAAIAVVSIASRREEAEHSLSRQAPGAVARAARRLLAYRAEDGQSHGQPVHSAARGASGDRHADRSAPDLYAFEFAAPAGRSPGQAALAAREVRFGHARRPVSDSRQYPASRQPQPRAVRADQRQGAGV